MKLYLQRKAVFQAGIDGNGNLRLRGGHSYSCTLTVSGSIDPATGMVVNIREIDQLLRRNVLSKYDGAILDKDIPKFLDKKPTDENIIREIWDNLECSMPERTRLEEVVLSSSPVSVSILSRKRRSHDKPMLTVTRAYDFSAAHRLSAEGLSSEENLNIFGKCNWENGHGHNYELEVTLAGECDPVTEELFSSELLDDIVEREVLSRYDHKNLNVDVEELARLNPTSENVTRAIWERLSLPLKGALGDHVRLHRIAVRETARNYFEYYGE